MLRRTEFQPPQEMAIHNKQPRKKSNEVRESDPCQRGVHFIISSNKIYDNCSRDKVSKKE